MFDNIHPQIQLLFVAHAAQPYALSTIQQLSLVFLLSKVTKAVHEQFCSEWSKEIEAALPKPLTLVVCLDS